LRSCNFFLLINRELKGRQDETTFPFWPPFKKKKEGEKRGSGLDRRAPSRPSQGEGKFSLYRYLPLILCGPEEKKRRRALRRKGPLPCLSLFLLTHKNRWEEIREVGGELLEEDVTHPGGV